MQQPTTIGARAALGAAIATIAVLGIWITGNATPNVFAHGAAVAALSIVLAAGVLLATRGRRDLRMVGLGSLAATMVVALAIGGVLSRPTSVDEQVVTADVTAAEVASAAGTKAASAPGQNVLVAAGEFESLAHDTAGTARIIKLADGAQKLTLEGFSTTPGPDLKVYLVAGSPTSDGEVTDYVDLGALKGNEGNQQYDLPEGFDASKYQDVFIWCRAFTVGFGKASLEP